MAPQTTPGSSINQGPTPAQMAEQIAQLQQQISQLHQAKHHKDMVFKMEKPTAFNGTKDTLRGFITQCRAYFLHHNAQFTNEIDKVVFAGHRLEGDALA